MRSGSRKHRRRASLALSFPIVVLLALPALAKDPGADLPPPTPVPAPGGQSSPSPFPTVLDTPPPSTELPSVSSSAVVLADLDTGQVLFSSDPRERRPIASLTKIMTALVTLERTRPSDVVTVSDAAANAYDGTYGISQLDLVPGERITVEDLLYALLLQSANDAAFALAEHVSGSVEAFVKDMNVRARQLGMSGTRFASPNGLDDRGYSTASDLMRVTRAAFREPLFARIVATRFAEIPSSSGPPREIQNRNVLLWLYPGATGVKTGYTSGAGYNVVGAADRDDLHLVAVVLGGTGAGEVFSDAATLLNYGFTAFERARLVQAGADLGEVRIDGRAVPVAAGSSLEALVPADADIARRLVVSPEAAFPPAHGEQVGSLKLSIPGRQVGQVPAVATDVPGPLPATGPGPWWRRATSAVAGAVAAVLGAILG